MDDNDGLTLVEDLELHSLRDTPSDSAINILLPVDLGKVWLLLCEVEWVDSTIQVAISGSAGITGDHEDRADWTVLGEKTSTVSTGGENNDSTSIHVQTGTNSSHGARLDNTDWALNEVAELLEVRNIRDSVLGFQAGLVHLGNSLVGVATLGSLTRQHNTVGSISDGVTDIADLGTGWARVVDHGLEHLGGTDDWLARHVAHGNHLLLGSEHLGCWDFNTQITTGNHDTIGLLEDLGKVVETLSVLNLGDNLDVLSLFAENLADGLDILTTADE